MCPTTDFPTTIKVTATSIISIPKTRRGVSRSPKIITPKKRAVTGSNAPKMAVGVEPMLCIEIAVQISEITVGRKAIASILTHAGKEGTACRSVIKFRRTT